MTAVAAPRRGGSWIVILLVLAVVMIVGAAWLLSQARTPETVRSALPSLPPAGDSMPDPDPTPPPLPKPTA